MAKKKATFELMMLEQKKSLSAMDVNTPEQIERCHYYYERYLHLRGRQEERVKEWERLHRLYKCERDDYNTVDHTAPKSFCSIVTPIVEGQTAGLVEYNLDVNIIGTGPTDNDYAKTLQSGADFILRNNRFKQYAKDYARSYLLYGGAWMTCYWDNKAYGGLGIPRLRIPTISKVYVDGRIKDYKDLQCAEYVIEEIGFKSIAWAKREYGDRIADAIVRMNNNYQFDQQDQRDDIDSFMLLHVWTRNNEQGNLQLIEMTTNPMVLRESDPSEPYYRFGDNEYPFAFARLYPQQMDFYGFGDGRILEPIQRTVNKLFDEIEIACRFQAQAKTYVDPTAEMDDDQCDSDPSHNIMAKNPNQTIRVVQGAGINPVVENMISMLVAHAERATRFSGTMTGLETQNSVSATQSGIMLQQGSATINDKKGDLSEALQFIVKYSLKLALEFYDRGFWSRVGDENSYEYVDFSLAREVPAAMPATNAFKDSFASSPFGNAMAEAPNYQLVEDGPDSTPVMKSIDFDVKVTLGEGLPSNRIAIHNVLMNLFQMQVIDQMQFAKMTEKYLGIDLDVKGMEERARQQQMDAQAQPSPSGIVNPASETSVGVPMGVQASATSNPGMTGTVPGGGAMPMRSAGAV